jgi:hypothetical protein
MIISAIPVITSGMAKIRAGSGDHRSRSAANAVKASPSVADVADRDGRPDCFLDGLSQVEVHLGDESGKDVIGIGAPLEALSPPERLQRAISEHGVHVTDGNPAASTS